MNFAEWLVRHGRVTPRAPAIYLGDELFCDYGELFQRTANLSGELARRGIGVGDRVALWMSNNPAYLEVAFAIWMVGAVAVPLNHKLHLHEALDICQACDATLMFVDKVAGRIDFVATIDVDDESYGYYVRGSPFDGPVRRTDQDVAWLFYTSGTTGRPKGAMLSFGNLRSMAQAYLSDVDRRASEKAMLYAAPMSHGAGLYSLPQVLIGGAHVIPKSRGFDPHEILRLADAELPPLSFFAAPTMVNRLVQTVRDNQYSTNGIGLIVYGGGPMYAADLEKAISHLKCPFAQIYGQGEAPMTITYLSSDIIADRSHPRWQQRIQSVGIPHSCAEVRIARAGGSVAPFETGEILTSGAAVMLGYWNDPDANERAVVDGWLHTGDIGFLDEEGFLTLTDRSKDLIISGGSNIYPREVEEVLLRHPTVEQVSVVGVPDSEWGEIAVAFVVSRAGEAQDDVELDQHCVQNIARFKRPKRYVFVKDLPKNAYGKVLKTKLREEYSS